MRQGNQPPVIAIASPADGIEVRDAHLELTYYARSPSGQRIIQIKATANVHPIPFTSQNLLKG